MEAILTANFICNEVICIAAEPKHSVFSPRILLLREFRKLFLQRIAELLCRRRCRAAIFKRSKRFKTRIRTCIKRTVHRHNFASSSKRIRNSGGTELFIRQAESRHFKRHPHGFSHRISAHHSERTIRTRILPNLPRSMLFQIRIQSRIPVRRKRSRPVHSLFAIHFGGQVVIQDLCRFSARDNFEFTVERSPVCPNRRHDLDPPFHLPLIISLSGNAPQASHSLECAENFGFIPLHSFNFIQRFCELFITGLRIKNLRKRFPGDWRYTGNTIRFVFRNRIQHRERVIRKFCIRHLACIIFRLFVHTRHTNRIRKIRCEIKGRKRRLFDDTHLLVKIKHAQFKNRHRSRISRRQIRRRDRFHLARSLNRRFLGRRSTRCNAKHACDKPRKAQKRNRDIFHFHKKNYNKCLVIIFWLPIINHWLLVFSY